MRKKNRDKNFILRNLTFLFDPEKDHYEPQNTVSAFYDDYIKYENIGDKSKTLTIKEYFDMIRSYLSDIINDCKTQKE